MTKEEIMKLVEKTELLGIVDPQYYKNEMWKPHVWLFAEEIENHILKIFIQECQKYLNHSNDDIRKTAFKCIFDIQARR